MKKWIAFVLLAGLTACSGNTTSDKTEPADETPAPAAEPAPAAPAPEVPPVPAAEAPKETPAATPAPAEKPAPKAETKPADKPIATTGAKLKPGLYAHFETSLGDFTAELNEKEAPITVASFAGLADGEKEWTHPKTGQKLKKPYYDGLIFHRIIDGFMIQGGDPLGMGTGGPGFTIQDEYNNLKHDKVGTLAMARTSQPNSAGSQFYITVAATPFLDGQRPPYVVFGQVVEGLDVVLKLGKVPTGPGDRPLDPPVIKRIRTERVK
jgi:peptidyl-prolyl cis-trans isomerase A (cyclophilin A)